MTSPTKDDSIYIPVRSFLDIIFGRKGALQEIPLTSICDYKQTRPLPFYRALTLYLFEDMTKLDDWKRVRKLKPINTFGLAKKDYRKMMKSIEEMTQANRQIGARHKGWFYSHDTKDLRFG